jgi:two-component system, cell cycle response regulator CtrA
VSSIILTGKLIINLDAETAAIGGDPLALTGREFAVLRLLAVNKGSTVMQETFLRRLYGEVDERHLRTLRVVISKLRRKIAQAGGGDLIMTVGRCGYLLRDMI